MNPKLQFSFPRGIELTTLWPSKKKLTPLLTLPVLWLNHSSNAREASLPSDKAQQHGRTFDDFASHVHIQLLAHNCDSMQVDSHQGGCMLLQKLSVHLIHLHHAGPLSLLVSHFCQARNCKRGLVLTTAHCAAATRYNKSADMELTDLDGSMSSPMLASVSYNPAVCPC